MRSRNVLFDALLGGLLSFCCFLFGGCGCSKENAVDKAGSVVEAVSNVVSPKADGKHLLSVVARGVGEETEKVDLEEDREFTLKRALKDVGYFYSYCGLPEVGTVEEFMRQLDNESDKAVTKELALLDEIGRVFDAPMFVSNETSYRTALSEFEEAHRRVCQLMTIQYFFYAACDEVLTDASNGDSELNAKELAVVDAIMKEKRDAYLSLESRFEDDYDWFGGYCMWNDSEEAHKIRFEYCRDFAIGYFRAKLGRGNVDWLVGKVI